MRLKLGMGRLFSWPGLSTAKADNDNAFANNALISNTLISKTLINDSFIKNSDDNNLSSMIV